jgi:putative membrane protein
MLPPAWNKNDRKAKTLIITFSIIVVVAISVLERYNLAGKVSMPFDVHLFAMANGFNNAIVALLLVAGLIAIKRKSYRVHKRIMLTAIVLSVLFLVSYICHHLFAGETIFGETDGIKGLSKEELTAAGSTRTIYQAILATHIPLAGLALPFILFTAYRSLTGDYEKHKRIARIVWPVWFYVAVTGVIVYIMIRPYYT